MENILIFPEPRETEVQEGRVELGADWQIVLPEEAEALEVEGAKQVKAWVRKRCGIDLSVVRGGESGSRCIALGSAAGTPPNLKYQGPEGYLLYVGQDRIHLVGNGPEGTFYAVQTLKQLLRGRSVPEVTIRDGPAMERRGLFLENKWGPDRMTLEDWKATIDFMAELKLNLLGIGLYGCWCVQYDGQITEFLLTPISEYPKLRTPKVIRYYSAVESTWKTADYLPPLFEEDLLGEIVAYGKTRNVLVRPHFNSLGHNTLIPRRYPYVSALDEEGRPTGYGFCTSNPHTYEMLFRIYDHIIDRYLAPHGVDYFHVGLDEVYPVVGADPTDPRRRVEPWCRCPVCRTKTREERFVEFLLRICEHLRDKGIHHICLWNDQLARHMDLLDEPLVAQMKERGVFDRIILQWWYYGKQFPETIRPELGLHRWVTPMSGYFYWRYYESYLENIYGMLRLGHEQGATGVETYGVFDEAFHRNYCCLTDYAWNPTGAGDLDRFRDKYTQVVFQENAAQSKEALDQLDRMTDYGLMNILAHYAYTYPNPNLPYPRAYPGEALKRLCEDRSGWTAKMKELAGALREAEATFTSVMQKETAFPKAVRNYAAEARRGRALIEDFLSLFEVLDLCQAAVEALADGTTRKEKALEKLGTAKDNVQETLTRHDEAMAGLEEAKAIYLQPQALRELSYMRAFLVSFSEELRTLREEIQRGERDSLPPLEVEDLGRKVVQEVEVGYGKSK